MNPQYRSQKTPELGTNLAILVGLFYPLTNSIFSAITGNMIKAGWLFIFSIALILAVSLRRFSRIRIDSTWVCAALINIIFIIDMFIRGGQTQTILFEYCMAFVFVIFLTQHTGWIPFTLKIFLVCGIFYSLTVWFQVINPDSFSRFATPLFLSDFQKKFVDLHSWGYNCGLTTQVAIVCCYIVSGMCVFIPYVFSKVDNKEKIKPISIIVLLVLVSSLLVTGKRASLLFMIFAYMIFYYVKAENVGKRFKFGFIVISAFILFYTIGIPLIENSQSNMFATINRFIALMNSDDITNGRIHYIEIGLNLIKEHPLLGVGWDNFSKAADTSFNGHNIYVQLMAELGVPIGLFIIALLFKIWNSTRKSLITICRTKKIVNKQIYIGVSFSFLAQTYFLIYGFAGNPLYDVEYIALYWISIIVYIALENSQKSISEKAIDC